MFGAESKKQKGSISAKRSRKEDKKKPIIESDEDQSDLEDGDSLSDDSMTDDSADIERDLSVTNTQLFKIERKIQQGTDLTKRERRLLQNRKSALKCRLKKQTELDKMKRQVDKLASENRDLKEKVSGGIKVIPISIRLAQFLLCCNARSKKTEICRESSLIFRCSRH